MPYADPEKRRQNSKRWREERIQQGYGKALYARRAQRYRNEETLRAAILTIDSMLAAGASPGTIHTFIEQTLRDAPPIGSPLDYMPKGEP